MKKSNSKEDFDNSLNKIAKSSILVFLGVLSSKILTYFYRIIIARYFGPEVYGIFSLATMILTWLVTLALLGLFDGVLRFVSLYRAKEETGKIRYVLKTSTNVLLVSSIFLGIVLFIFSEWISLELFHNQEMIIFLKIFSFIIPPFVFLYIFLAIIQAFEKINVYTFLLDFLENFLKLIFILILVFVGFKTNSIIFSYSLGVIVVLIIAIFYCKKNMPEIFGKTNLENKIGKDIKQKLFSYSWPLILSSILYVILPYIDSFVIGYFKGVTEVGLYNAAVPLAILLILPPTLFMRLFFPLATKEFSKKNFENLKELSKQVEKWILIANLPILFLMLIFPGAFLNILFGPEYIVAQNSLRILSVGYFFYSMSIIFYTLLSVVGKSKLMLSNIIITAIINLILNLLLIPSYGLNGAAISTSISYTILTIVLFFQIKKYTSIIPLRRKMLPVVLCIFVSAFCLIAVKSFFPPLNIALVILLGLFFLLFYVLLVFITKSLDKNDLNVLKSFQGILMKEKS